MKPYGSNLLLWKMQLRSPIVISYLLSCLDVPEGKDADSDLPIHQPGRKETNKQRDKGAKRRRESSRVGCADARVCRVDDPFGRTEDRFRYEHRHPIPAHIRPLPVHAPTPCSCARPLELGARARPPPDPPLLQRGVRLAAVVHEAPQRSPEGRVDDNVTADLAKVEVGHVAAASWRAVAEGSEAVLAGGIVDDWEGGEGRGLGKKGREGRGLGREGVGAENQHVPWTSCSSLLVINVERG